MRPFGNEERTQAPGRDEGQPQAGQPVLEVLTNEELEMVSGGAVLVIGNQDVPGDQSFHSADATVGNDNARRFFVITHNFGGLDNGPFPSPRDPAPLP